MLIITGSANLQNLCKQGVDSEESDMSFSLSVDGGKLEWGSHDLGSIFAQKSNMFSPSFLWMIREVLRFGKEAPKVGGMHANRNTQTTNNLTPPEVALNPENLNPNFQVLDNPVYDNMDLGGYLKKHGYSRAFSYNYLLPMCAAVWSVSNKQCLDFPIQVIQNSGQQATDSRQQTAGNRQQTTDCKPAVP